MVLVLWQWAGLPPLCNSWYALLEEPPTGELEEGAKWCVGERSTNSACGCADCAVLRGVPNAASIRAMRAFSETLLTHQMGRGPVQPGGALRTAHITQGS